MSLLWFLLGLLSKQREQTADFQGACSNRSIFTSTVLHPCDAVPTEKLVEAAAAHEGIVYLRTMRQNTPVIYGNEESFHW